MKEGKKKRREKLTGKAAKEQNYDGVRQLPSKEFLVQQQSAVSSSAAAPLVTHSDEIVLSLSRKLTTWDEWGVEERNRSKVSAAEERKNNFTIFNILIFFARKRLREREEREQRKMYLKQNKNLRRVGELWGYFAAACYAFSFNNFMTNLRFALSALCRSN
jgi:hypothetical protein